MWFKNLIVYRMPAHWVMAAADIEEALSTNIAVPLSPSQAIGHGWAPVHDDQLVHVVNRQMMLMLSTDKKVLPSSAVKAAVAQRIAEVADATGRKPGRKERREITEAVIATLLPTALAANTSTAVWIDPVHGWLVVNTGSSTRADIVVTQLIKALERLSLETLYLAREPMAVLTECLASGDAPYGFTMDSDCELKATDESKATVKYGNHNLDIEDLRTHLKQGKRCTKLALTWNDRISFVMTENFRIKRVKPLDIITEETVNPKEADERERFDSDFVMMTGELNNMLSALLEVFGGEKPRDTPAETKPDDLFN